MISLLNLLLISTTTEMFIAFLHILFNWLMIGLSHAIKFIELLLCLNINIINIKYHLNIIYNFYVDFINYMFISKIFDNFQKYYSVIFNIIYQQS